MLGDEQIVNLWELYSKPGCDNIVIPVLIKPEEVGGYETLSCITIDLAMYNESKFNIVFDEELEEVLSPL